jgi:hypothetical protein
LGESRHGAAIHFEERCSDEMLTSAPRVDVIIPKFAGTSADGGG